MIYHPFQEKKLSALGMGAMRLPTTGERGPIDEARARALIDRAMEAGINYYDTAYRYHNGESEPFIGRALADYPRDSWYLASKMPGHMAKNSGGKLDFGGGLLAGHPLATPAEVFERQLEKCRVDFFDFYLLHNLCETSYDMYTDESLGILEYLLDQKKKGRIRHLGFSAHGRAETIAKFLDERPVFEFVQIQINYLDWSLQDAGRKYEVITSRGLPVIAMEPVRGGKLANLAPEAARALRPARPDASIASWAFRYLQSLPGIVVSLSGMTTMDQLEDNLATYRAHDPLTEEEHALLGRIVAQMADMVPCTACRYCTDACPQSLDIPTLISMYNETAYEPSFTLRFTLDAMSAAERPGACIACGACAPLCPQNIDIPEVMQKYAALLEA
jgi:predicted aldo/keto reductase-like oxidoreductase